MDDNGHKTDIIINSAIHVPTLDVRLISTKQFTHKNVHQDAEGDI